MIEQVPELFWAAIKILSLLGIGIYIVFAAVIVRQERLMGAVIEEGFEPFVRMLAIIHLFASVAIFFLAVMLL